MTQVEVVTDSKPNKTGVSRLEFQYGRFGSIDSGRRRSRTSNIRRSRSSSLRTQIFDNSTPPHHVDTPSSQIDLSGNSTVSLQNHLSSSSLLSSNRQLNVTATCICPVSVDCPRRTNEKLDCRTLVANFQSWQLNTDEACYRIQTSLRNPGRAPVATSLRLADIVTYINRFYDKPRLHSSHLTNNGRIIDWIIEMHNSNVTSPNLETSQVLPALEIFVSPEMLEMRIFKRMPEWITEEITILYRRWNRGDYDCDPKRGLILEKKRKPNGELVSMNYRIDKDWPHYEAANYYGAGELVNGQLWLSRTELQRDGVHSAPVAGISGNTKEGAYSVVMGLHDEDKKQYYADVDMGEIVHYEGTALPDPEDPNRKNSNLKDPDMNRRPSNRIKKPTNCTQMLMKSRETGNPVRLIRSFGLADIVKHKPKRGYRYDGLYKVVDMTLQKEQLQIWSFKLVREPGQGPLRGIVANGRYHTETGRQRSVTGNADTNSSAGVDRRRRAPEREGWRT